MESVNNMPENEAAIAIEELYTEDEIEVWEEILDYSIFEFCLDVHRAVKLNYLYLDPALDPNYEPEERNITHKADKDGQKPRKSNENTSVDCPNCNNSTTSFRLGTHLPKCLGIGGRTNTRETNKKGTGDTEENESEAVPSTSGAQNKGRKSKKRRNKKIQKTKADAENSPKPFSEMNGDLESIPTAENSPRPSSEIDGDMENTPNEEKEAFFNEECDAVTETNKSFEHSDEEKEAIQTTHLRELNDVNTDEVNADIESNLEMNADSESNSEISADIANNSEINVDTAHSEFNADTASKDEFGYFAT